MFRQLDPQRIHETTLGLSKSIAEQFPGSGLSQVAGEVESASLDAIATAEKLVQPMVGLRVAAIMATVALVVLMVVVLVTVRVSLRVANASELAQGIEAFVNDIVFTGIAVWFLFSIENRRKRKLALNTLGELRSLAHVVDLHQMNKDPARVGNPVAPAQPMGERAMARYLDNCAELLAILGKLAALCAQRFNDPVTLAAVNEVEILVSGLSRKIWQKIMIIDQVQPPMAVKSDGPARPSPQPSPGVPGEGAKL